jgi:thiamine pyrophosphokinase
MSKCVIIGAGECDVENLKRTVILDKSDICIAADGGLDYAMAARITPDLVIGDMDSLADKGSLENFNVQYLPVEKDDTDMLAAIKAGLDRGCAEFEIYGGMGGSIDHTIANIQCLVYIINNGASGKLISDRGSTITLISGERMTFEPDEYPVGKRISIFAVGGNAEGVTVRGLKYTVFNTTLKTDFPIGVSNEFIGEDAYIEVKDGILMIYVD